MATALDSVHPEPVEGRLLRKGIDEFNAWRFYDCHETLEDLWRDSGGKGDDVGDTNFYQGLI